MLPISSPFVHYLYQGNNLQIFYQVALEAIVDRGVEQGSFGGSSLSAHEAVFQKVRNEGRQTVVGV
jgi:hypothetical protein